MLKNTGWFARGANKGEDSRAHLLGLLALDQSGVHVGHDTASGDGGLAHVLVELLIVSHCHADVAGSDAVLLVVLGGVSSQLKELSGQVLEDGCHVHWGPSANTLGEATFLQVTGKTSNGEGQTSLGGTTLRAGLLGGFLAFARHDID